MKYLSRLSSNPTGGNLERIIRHDELTKKKEKTDFLKEKDEYFPKSFVSEFETVARCLLLFVLPVPGHTTARGFSPDNLIPPPPLDNAHSDETSFVIIANHQRASIIPQVFETWADFYSKRIELYLEYRV